MFELNLLIIKPKLGLELEFNLGLFDKLMNINKFFHRWSSRCL